MFNAINRLIVEAETRRQQGQGLVEYGLILGLVSLAAVVALGTVGTDVNTIFTNIATRLAAAA